MNESITSPWNPWRSTLALVAGFLAVVILSLGTDQVFHMLKVYPPWGEPMREPSLNLLALAYRIIYAILGGYVAARLAPRNPMRHVFILAVIGVAFGVAGVIGTQGLDLGPRWYPIAIAVSALPCTLIGGVFYRTTSPES